MRTERAFAWVKVNGLFALSRTVLRIAWLGRRAGILTGEGVDSGIALAERLADRARRIWARYKWRRDQLKADSIVA